ncbi:MAG: prepilin peptidase [bacterium]|nr:prepilin peptidase [bacterium]MDZ4285241.1 prepilin peptidase [Patescibacteria group bacterium]
MGFLLVIFTFVFGAIVGSFLNVVALRYNSGVTLGGRSRCFSCSAILAWFDLVPVVSFIALRGRCRRCGSAISLQYPVVELITGVVFALVLNHELGIMNYGAAFSAYFILHTAYFMAIFSLLIAISVYDLRHKIIPNGLVYLFSALTFSKLLIELASSNPQLLVTSYQLLASGPLLAAPFAALWLLSGGRWMGLGDAKLALGIGWLLGFSTGIAALVLSFWIGAVVSLGILLAERARLFSSREDFTMKSEIPFGPFLVAGTFLAWFFGLDVAALVWWF